MDLKEKTVCFTGHREIRAKDKNLKEKLKTVLEGLIQQDFLYFGAGGARSFDALASLAVLELKEKYQQIHLILVLPFVNQYEHEKGWTQEEIQVYQEQKKKASKVVYTQEAYSSGCYYKRNRHLVNFSRICVCDQYKNSGGTAYTTKYAQEKELTIINCI